MLEPPVGWRRASRRARLPREIDGCNDQPDKAKKARYRQARRDKNRQQDGSSQRRDAGDKVARAREPLWEDSTSSHRQASEKDGEESGPAGTAK